MKQQFLQVWQNGELWYEFPAENEDNVRLDLMRKGLDRTCDIRPAVSDVQVLKEAVKAQVKEIQLEPMADKAKRTYTRKPKAEEAKTNDTSGIYPTTL